MNYPSNMLYAGALDAAARIYRLPALARQARRVRATVRRQSFDGEFFVDNAVRENGALKATRNRSEVGQYFAFFFGAASPESHPELWRRLCADFGPGRKARGAFPEVHPANAFIGNVLRLELLSRGGRSRQAVEESTGYLLYMAEKTGTLWENDSTVASCNHGFASHAAHLLYRDALGIFRVDPVGRRIVLRFADLGLEWCRGAVPVPGGVVSLEWRRDGRTVRYRPGAPAGYAVEIENPEGLELVLE